MTDGADATERLNAEKYLRFDGWRAGPNFHDLTVSAFGTVIAQTSVGRPELEDSVQRLIGKSRAIITKPGCLRYTLIFRNCISYMWLDEMLANPETGEMCTEVSGAHLGQLRSSRFLTHLHSATGAQGAIDDEILHFRLSTLDAIIDVACTAPPEVTATVLTTQDLGRPKTH